MSLETALVAIKSANSTLNGLIGTHFHPEVLPQKDPRVKLSDYLPAICFQEVSRPRDYTWGIPLPSLSHPLVLMKCYARTPSLRAALAVAARAAFSSTTSQSAGGATVDGMTIENELSGGVELLDTETEAYVQILFVRVHIRE